MKIFGAGIATETNTFSPVPTSLEDFQVRRATDALTGEHPSADVSDIWGRQAKVGDHEFVLSLMAFAQPSGLTTKFAYEALRDEVLRDLRKSMPVDIVLLMLHGAMVARGYEDCEEDVIRQVRAITGPTAIIGVELDLHCHLSESMLEMADIVLTFKEFPHVDANDRAQDLFDLALAARRGETRPVMALFDCRMIGIYPTSRQPLRGIVDALSEAERRPGVLSVSFAHGYPFADLPHMGAKVLVVTDNDPVLAKRVAREFGMQIYGSRQEIGFDSLSLTLEDALSRGLKSTRRPVIVADQSDNPGGGAPGDATFALRWLLEHQAEDVGMAIFYDPEVVKIARRAGTGAVLRVRLGGKLGPTSGDPVDIEVNVLSTLDNYWHAFPQQSGAPELSPLGDVVALRCGSIDIIVASERCQCYTPAVFSDLGIDPLKKQLLITKSTQHFYAAFAPIAGEILYMAGPGAVAPNPIGIPYRRVNTRELYPWVYDPLG